jgi:hypothetical protein
MAKKNQGSGVFNNILLASARPLHSSVLCDQNGVTAGHVFYQAGNSIGPGDGGHIHKGSWYVEAIGKCPYLVQRSQAYVQAYAEKVVFWNKKTG